MDNVYLDEIIPLVKKINKRRASSYKMLAAIAAFPHLEKKDKEEFVDNLSKIDPDHAKKSNKLDEAGMNTLKAMMSRNGSKMLVK